MLKKFTVSLFITALILAPSISGAKEVPPGRWWRVPYFYTALDITDQQKDELDKLFEDSRQRLVDLKKELELEKRDLDAMLEQKDLNEKAAAAQMKQLESTRTKLAATRFSYSLEVRKLLGHERFQQLRALYRNWQGAR